jgi:Mg-chelatase subunit ChlD
MAGALLGATGCLDYAFQDPDTRAPDPVEVDEEFVQAPLPGLDVLFVVDSTGSMAEEQAAFADAATAFVDALGALDLSYQLGVTTSDLADAGALQGRP